MIIRRRLSLILLLVLVSLVVPSTNHSALNQSGMAHEATHAFAIKDVRIFDGERVIPRATVIVNNGLIARVGKGLPLPTEIEVVDGAGYTLLPGLIDAHVHYISPRSLNQAAVFGVTTELDMGGDYKSISKIKNRILNEMNLMRQISCLLEL